ncbi:MAG: hypothetical protein AAGB14_07525 [Verrucomicrobiota bacterium]
MNEKGSSMWLKAMAVTSAVALGGGYVVWKDAQAKNARIEALEQRVADWEKSEESASLFVGSKNPGGQVITFPVSGTDFVEPVEIDGLTVQPTLMPGSKSALVYPPSGDDGHVRILPGSKSLAPIFETPKKTEEEDQP